jgi:hypothetical protein
MFVREVGRGETIGQVKKKVQEKEGRRKVSARGISKGI